MLGAVNKPGVQQIEGPKTLVEMLSLAGGLREDAGAHDQNHSAGRVRGSAACQAPTATPAAASALPRSTSKKFSKPAGPKTISLISPHDVISVPRADMVYVIGEVEKSGGFVLEQRQSVSVLQALSLAGGLTDVAALEQRPDSARRRRRSPGAAVEIAVDLKAIMAGKSPDVALEPEDILFVPRSGGRAAGQAVRTSRRWARCRESRSGASERISSSAASTCPDRCNASAAASRPLEPQA